MIQKEDSVRKSDQNVLNPAKWLKKLTMILISVLLLTMFGLGGYWLSARQQQSPLIGLLTKLESSRLPTSSSIQQRSTNPTITADQAVPPVLPLDTSDWKVYRSGKYRFQVKHPGNWKVSVNQLEFNLISSSSGSYFVVVEERNPKSLTLDEWFKEATVVDRRPTIKASAQSTIINGNRVYLLETQLKPPNPLFEVYISDKKKRIFTLFAYSKNSADALILRQILRSWTPI
jgi:hypothetical protein